MLFRNTPLLSYSFCFVWFSLDWPKNPPPHYFSKELIFSSCVTYKTSFYLMDAALFWACFIHPFVNRRKRSEATRKSRLMTGVVPLPDQSMLTLVTRILIRPFHFLVTKQSRGRQREGQNKVINVDASLGFIIEIFIWDDIVC